MKAKLKKEIAVDKKKEVDDDVATLMDMVIGDYLCVLIEDHDENHVEQCKNGIRKVCAAFNINPKGLDVDKLM